MVLYLAVGVSENSVFFIAYFMDAISYRFLFCCSYKKFQNQPGFDV